MTPTTAQVTAALDTLRAIGDAIRELKSVPSGVLYAQVMHTMDLATYNKCIELLKGAGVVRETNRMLEWVLEDKPKFAPVPVRPLPVNRVPADPQQDRGPLECPECGKEALVETNTATEWWGKCPACGHTWGGEKNL